MLGNIFIMICCLPYNNPTQNYLFEQALPNVIEIIKGSVLSLDY